MLRLRLNVASSIVDVETDAADPATVVRLLDLVDRWLTAVTPSSTDTSALAARLNTASDAIQGAVDAANAPTTTRTYSRPG